MPEQTPGPEDLDLPAGRTESPLHGYRGDARADVPPELPISLAIAISREAGARGTTIAERAGAKLGWQVYGQDLLEYMVRDTASQAELLAQLPANAPAWVEDRLNRLLREQNLSRNPSVLELARLVLLLAAQGEAILLGRGAGCVLPARSTLNVRLVAPLEERVAYMAQWLRLTEEEAAVQVRKRDERRAEFISTHFHRSPSDPHQYDLILNTGRLGEERCAELIVQAAHAKLSAMHDVAEAE
jgi:cytidylate kinase